MESSRAQESVILKMMSVGSMPLPITQVSYDANGNMEYIGVAMQGSGTGEAKWRIEKMTWESDGSGGYRYTGSRFSRAGVVWSSRTTLTYT